VQTSGFLCLAILSGGAGLGCNAADDSAGQTLASLAVKDTAAVPEGYLFAASGTHVERCTGAVCPTMWAATPSPNNCGGGFEPAESYIVHQRGTDWDGLEGEAELQGHEYELTQRITPFPSPGVAAPGTVPTRHNQSVIIQCCPAEPRRTVRPGAFIDMKVCPDPCDAPDGLCPITMADRTDSQTFGKCKTVATYWLIETDRCDLAVVEAGWNDPHAPHDLANPSGEDKRVFALVYRAAWTSQP
jgi:hypothetical protein